MTAHCQSSLNRNGGGSCNEGGKGLSLEPEVGLAI